MLKVLRFRFRLGALLFDPGDLETGKVRPDHGPRYH